MDFIKKNWLLLTLILVALTFGSLWTRSGILGRSAKNDLADAGDRITELEDSIGKSTKYTGKLEENNRLLSADNREIRARYTEFRDAYYRIRDSYFELESTTEDLERSNDRSLGLVREGLKILEERTDTDL